MSPQLGHLSGRQNPEDRCPLCVEQPTSRVRADQLVPGPEIANEFRDVRSPSIECVLAFGEKVMPLIDRCDAGICSRLVVEYLVRDMGWNTRAGHAGNNSAPEIMQAPTTDTGEFV